MPQDHNATKRDEVGADVAFGSAAVCYGRALLHCTCSEICKKVRRFPEAGSTRRTLETIP
jgi:hypothetical protein